MIAERPVALVTDGPRGIGQAIALALAAAGFDLVIDDVVQYADAEATLAGMAERDAGASFVATAIVDPAAHPRLADAAFRRLDCLVNSAGGPVLSRGDLLDVMP